MPPIPDEQVEIRVFDHHLDPELLTQIAAVEALAFSEPWGLESLGRTLGQPGSALAVVFSPGDRRPLAFCLYQQIVDEVSILQIATAPVARRRGHGMRLLRRVQQLARESGCAQLFLEVRRGNTAALGLYEAAGFVPQAVRRSYYADNGEDALVLSHRLQLPA